MSLLNSAFLLHARPLPPIPLASAEQLQQLVSFLDLRTAVTMAERSTADLLGVVEIFGSFLYPLALTLQLPLYVFVMVLEKESLLREMQLQMGIKRWAYHVLCSYGLYDYGLYSHGPM